MNVVNALIDFITNGWFAALALVGGIVFGVALLAENQRYRRTRHAFREGDFENGVRQAGADALLLLRGLEVTENDRRALHRIAAAIAAHRRARDDRAFAPAERGYFDGLERALMRKASTP